MLNRVASKLKSRFQPKAPPRFEEIPRLAGGASLVYPSSWLTDTSKEDNISNLENAFHGLFQASVTANPGSVFLIGVDEDEIKQRYPMAQALQPTEKVGRVSMTPASVMSILRGLFGESSMRPYLWDLFYLEQAGNELSKPGPMAMIPEWVKEQLKVETIGAAICGMHRHDATVGAAVRALMKQEHFKFELIDSLYRDAEDAQGALSASVSASLSKWSIHASEVVTALRTMIDEPPIALQYLPAIRDAQAGQPGVYYLADSAMSEVAPVLDALVLSSGLGAAHHWYINTTALGHYHTDGLNAANRLAAALWQAREARESGFGPVVWWDIGGEIPLQNGAKTYQHRCIQGSSFIIGSHQEVVSAAEKSLDIELSLDAPVSDHQIAAFRISDKAFRHLNENEERAARHHSYAPKAA